MYLNLAHDIRIAGQRLRDVQSVEVSHTWRELTGRATIRFPRTRALREGDLRTLFPIGAPVSIRLGYDQVFATEFLGYVLSIKPAENVEIVCENEAFALKRISATGATAAGKLDTLIRKVLPTGILVATIPDITIGPWRYARDTPAQIITRACRQLGLFPFFRLRGANEARVSRLYVGRPYTDADRRTVKVNLQRDVPSNTLEFRQAADNPLELTAINYLRSGKVQTLVLGEKGGAARTAHWYGLAEANLQREAEAVLSRMRFDGYSGDLIAYGLPYVQQGDILQLTDQLEPTRSGSYYVDATKVSFGDGGYRRHITLGPTTVSADVAA
jgi:hypothetical protein